MIDVLWEEAGLPEKSLPPILRALYGGGIGFRRPALYANFAKSNGLIADDSEADRLVMGLLRACAHAVLIGSGTLLASPKGTWRLDQARSPPPGTQRTMQIWQPPAQPMRSASPIRMPSGPRT
jgi:hypothetical protein